MKRFFRIYFNEIVCFTFIGLVYIVVFLIINNLDFIIPTRFAYYNDLVDSLLQLKFNVNSPNKFELSNYNSLYYLYGGPAPALYVFLWTKIILIDSDKIYTLFAGLSNVIIFYFFIHEVLKYFKVKINRKELLLLLLYFSFLTPSFYLSMNGLLWHTTLIVSTFYLLLFLYFLFKCLNTNYSKNHFILSVIFFNLTWLSRFTLITYILLLFYVLWIQHDNKIMSFKNNLRVFLFICTMCLLLFFFYNYSRFGNIFETGYRYIITFAVNQKMIHETGIFSYMYLPKNIYYYFISPIFITPLKPLFLLPFISTTFP